GDGVEVSPAYVGLLEKLRESIRSRVRTIPQPSSHAVNQEVRASSGVGQRESAASEGKNLDHFSKNQFTDIPESLISDRAESASLEGNVSWNSDAHEESFKGDRVHQQAKPLAAGSVTETSGEHNDGELDAGDNIPARVGVLFSGGLDSVVVAAMLAEEGAGPAAVPRGEAIDLINVCFDSPSGHTSPDRVASMVAVDELQTLFPFHRWRLLCVDASYEDVLNLAEPVWRVMQASWLWPSLATPCSTTMDFNIASAFWFAARGVGRLYQSQPGPRTPPPGAPHPFDNSRSPGAVPVANGDIGCETSIPSSKDVCRTRYSPLVVAPSSRELGGGVEVVPCEDQRVAPLPATVSAPAGDEENIESHGLKENMAGLGSEGEHRMLGGLPRTIVAGAKTMVPGNDRGVGQEGNKKVNKNMDELCPVEGCRRLLKPGCVFGSCSKCCLKAQQLVSTASPANLSVASARGSPSNAEFLTPSTSQGCSSKHEARRTTNSQDGATSVERESGLADEHGVNSCLPGARPGVEGKQERCKARAAAQTMRALEDHLVKHFEELSPPFHINHLCAVLRGKLSTREGKTGRDLHARTRAQQPTKLCVVHKRNTFAGHMLGAGQTEKGTAVGNRNAVPGSGSVSWTKYKSEARVLMVGIGADEFMGGYSRHRNAYTRGGTEALVAELTKDQGRLWTRNLGRDDRAIADHGREARFPFLDEGVLDYIRSLALQDICDMEQPAGYGDKKILREVAAHLGLDSCRALPKRAIQFGSRIAQHCSRHTYGSHRRGSGSVPASANPLRFM
ncbi:unnamed protein product, partial [Sphacelaria rigidula]